VEIGWHGYRRKHYITETTWNGDPKRRFNPFTLRKERTSLDGGGGLSRAPQEPSEGTHVIWRRITSSASSGTQHMRSGKRGRQLIRKEDGGERKIITFERGATKGW